VGGGWHAGSPTGQKLLLGSRSPGASHTPGGSGRSSPRVSTVGSTTVESPSGRGRTPRKRVKGQPFRGFKSHLHRQRATGGSAHPGGARRDAQIRNQPGSRSVLLEPQSTVFFLLLLVRRPRDLAAVPQPGPRPPGRDLPGRGPARLHRADAAGPATGPALGHRRLLGGRVLRREPRAQVRHPVRLLRCAQRVLPAAGQPGRPPGAAGEPVRRERQAEAREHPDRPGDLAAGGHAGPAVLAGGRQRRPL
jgi:hypothetical protein